MPQNTLESREVTQQLVILDAVAEDLPSKPVSTWLRTPSLTPIPGDLTYSSDVWRHLAHMQYTYIHAGKIFKHVK